VVSLRWPCGAGGEDVLDVDPRVHPVALRRGVTLRSTAALFEAAVAGNLRPVAMSPPIESETLQAPIPPSFKTTSKSQLSDVVMSAIEFSPNFPNG
jgi:hypothetical protein